MPIQATGLFRRIIVFSEKKGYAYPDVQYITLDFLGKISILRLRQFIRILVEPIQLIYYALKLRPGLINSYQLVPKAYYNFLASSITRSTCMISSIGGIPEVKTYLKFPHFFESINIFVLKHTDIVTTKGYAVTNYIKKKGVKPEKIFTFNGAIDTSIYYNQNLRRDIDVLFVGSLIEVKGPDRFVKIIKILYSRHIRISAVMLGDGNMRNAINDLIEENELQGIIKMPGFIENPLAYFRRAKILLMPSRSEGLSTAMLEAMACGCVPVISNVGCMTEAAINEYNSLVVDDYKDISAYVNSISHLLDNTEKLKKLSLEATSLVQAVYSIENQCRIFKMILKSTKYS